LSLVLPLVLSLASLPVLSLEQSQELLLGLQLTQRQEQPLVPLPWRSGMEKP
jgi:hypothetical protein